MGHELIDEHTKELVVRAVLLYHARARRRKEFFQRVDMASVNEDGNYFLITLENSQFGWLIICNWNSLDDTMAILKYAPTNSDICTGLDNIINPNGIKIFRFID
jgi:hypothetical protein